MSNVTRTVKSLGGDYTSLNAALVGEVADLTTNAGGSGSAGILTIECYAMEDTVAAATGTGYVTSANYYINIIVPVSERHSGKWDATKYRMTASAANVPTLDVEEPYTRVTGVQVHNTLAGHWAIGYKFLDATNARFEKCIAWMDGGNFVKTGFQWTRNVTSTMVNCLAVVDSSYNNASNCCFIAKNGSTAVNTVYLYNCTAIGGKYGYRDFPDIDQTVVLTNCLAKGSLTADFSVGYPGTSDYNASGDATAPGVNSRTIQTFTFVDEANDDYHLSAADAGAKDHGVTDPGSGLYLDDIDGETRSGTWDIGADEYVAAGGGGTATPVFMHHYRMMAGNN